MQSYGFGGNVYADNIIAYVQQGEDVPAFAAAYIKYFWRWCHYVQKILRGLRKQK